MAMETGKTEKMRKLFADKQLSAEQLEDVAGGDLDHCGGKGDDSRFLNVLLRGHPAQPDRHNGYTASFTEIRTSWKIVGVNLVDKGIYGYRYSINGNIVSAEEAYRHAMKVMGKQLKPSDWYWD